MMKKTDPPIVIQESFNTSIEVVWRAITDPSEMTQWFFDNIPDFEPRIGFRTQFVVKNSDRIFTHSWAVSEVIENKKLTLNWKYLEYAGDAIVTFSLQKKENFVELKLEMKILEDFPDHIPEFTRQSCIGGWNYFIKEQLKGYLSNK
tara:strand:- start:2340 stop:2780 length:441 start_codon:yes stop_codon:yes gene_type:complete